jgi:hypothetical protein
VIDDSIASVVEDNAATIGIVDVDSRQAEEGMDCGTNLVR